MDSTHKPDAFETGGTTRADDDPLPTTAPRRSALGQLKALARFLAPYRKVILAALVALVVAAIATLGIGMAIRRIVDMGFSAANAGFIDSYFAALMGVALLLAAATFGRFYSVSWLGERVVADLRRAVYGHLLDLSPAFFENTSASELTSRLTTDTTLIQNIVGSSASVALRNLLLLVGGTVLLAVSSPRLTILVVVVVPLVVLPIIFFGRRVRHLSRATQDRIADVSAQAGETLGAIQIVQAYTQEDAERATFAETVESAFTTAVRRIRARAWLTALVILMVFGAVDLVLWSGAKDVIAGDMSGGELAAFVFYAILVAGAVGALSEVYGDLQRAAGAVGRIMELLALEPDIHTSVDPVPLPVPPQGAVAFEGVHFRYPSRPDTSALEDFSLHIAPGETIALVGPSGAGKTTVLQLLLRFYDPFLGTVAVDGVDISRVRPADVRARMALVPQETVIFAASAFDNIRYGRPDASEDEVHAAAEAAAAMEFLNLLPHGLHTHLGEHGVRLSGGQRQRIAIARAILRDPPILLLDEATSALDSESERLVQMALTGLMRNRTTLVIAHRLATVKQADRIVVMNEGRIEAIGTHGSLSADDGLYARLAALQFGPGTAPRDVAASDSSATDLAAGRPSDQPQTS